MGKVGTIALLLVAELSAMSVWFSSAAVIAQMAQEAPMTAFAAAALSSGVQAGFALGAVVFAVLGVADRFDPRKVFAISALGAAVLNAALVVAPVGGAVALAARVGTGFALAGVYPVGLKIAVGWGRRDRGFLVGLLVGALTFGSATPYLLSFLGGADWKAAVLASSGLAALGAVVVLFCALGPHHAAAPQFRAAWLRLAWDDPAIRRAYAGYLGHMWELYALWAWVGFALTVAFSSHMTADDAAATAKVVAFAAIGAGAVAAVAAVAAGLLADRIGKAETAILAMAGSASCAILAAFTFSGPPLLLGAVVVVWGAFVVADSAQFSALVADNAPPEAAGALMTLQTALGFCLTVLTVQLTPIIAGATSWPVLFALLAVGPVLGLLAMRGLTRNRATPSEGRAG